MWFKIKNIPEARIRIILKIFRQNILHISLLYCNLEAYHITKLIDNR